MLACTIIECRRALQIFTLVCLLSSLETRAHADHEAKKLTCNGADMQRGIGLLQAGSGSLAVAVATLPPQSSMKNNSGSLDLRSSHQEVKPAGHLNEHKEFEGVEARTITCICLWLVICFCTLHTMHLNDVHFVPETLVIIAQGVLLGLSLKYWAKAEFMQVTHQLIRPNEFVALLLLPPMMFESGWMMRRLDFISQLPFVLNFAIGGSLISILVIGHLLVITGRMGLHPITHYRSAFTIASTISATDPVATLGTYSHLKVDPLLNVMVSGEALLNDLVAIVMFHIFNDEKKADVHTILSIHSFAAALRLLFGSIAVAFVVGVVHCLVLRLFQLQTSKKIEITILMITSYIGFALGELFEFSGIIATLVLGIMLGQYARPHLSMEGSLLTTFLLSQLCTLIDIVISLMIGMSFLLVGVDSNGSKLGLWLTICCVIARFCAVFPMGWLCNFEKRRIASRAGMDEKDCNLLTSSHLFMIWHAGLRGAISLWLCMHIHEWMDDIEGPGTRLAVETGVLILLVALTAIFASSTKTCLKMVGMRMGEHFAHDHLSKAELRPEMSVLMVWVNDNILFPALVGSETEFNAAEIVRFNRRVDAEVMLKDAFHQAQPGTCPLETPRTAARKYSVGGPSYDIMHGSDTPASYRGMKTISDPTSSHQSTGSDAKAKRHCTVH